MHRSTICSIIASERQIQRSTFESSRSVAERMSLNIKGTWEIVGGACETVTSFLRFDVPDFSSQGGICATMSLPSPEFTASALTL